MTVFELYFWTLVLILVIATFLKEDYWPFSNYPMFSMRISLDTVQVYRIALVLKDGHQIWWNPPYAHLQQFLGRKIYKTWFDRKITVAKKKSLIRSVCDLSKHDPDEIEFISIQKRTCSQSNAEIADSEVLRISVTNI